MHLCLVIKPYVLCDVKPPSFWFLPSLIISNTAAG